MTKAAAVAFVLVATAVVLLVTGVSPAELVRFGLFEVGFVLLPGVVAHAALAPRRTDALERLAIGAGAGHAILLACFVVTAAAGARWALWLLPAAALVAAVRFPPWRRKPSALTARQAWALAGVAVAAVTLLAVALFSQAPLPGTTPSVSYSPDLMWGLGLAAEALHHWPMTTPQVLGEPLRYHTFAFMDVAATGRQSGIELPVAMLRLFPVSVLLAVVLQLAHAGRRFAGNPWAGPVAAALI